jgi:LuxR family maltose regulon positive regulatory protein
MGWFFAAIRLVRAACSGNEEFMGMFPSIPDIPHVRRVHLMRVLHDWQRTHVVAMIAPAGFGKSTTTMMWLREVLADVQPPRAAWVALNPTSDVPERFVELVGAQLQAFLPEVTNVLRLGRAGEFSMPQVWAAMLTEIARCDRQVILVLDDVHHIESDAVLALIQTMLDEASKNLHVVISSRSRPRLRYSRVQLAGAMLQLGPNDLAFGHDEFVEFVQTRWRVADLRPELLEGVEARICGWPAGLQLMSQALPATRNVTEADLEAISTTTDLWDYLESEIVRRMSDPMQQLLVQCSPLPFLSAGLCAAVLGWSNDEVQRTLESIAASNGLITSVQNKTSESTYVAYRVHPVLQEYLQRRLRVGHSTAHIGAQRRRAATWLAMHDNVDLALALLRSSLLQGAEPDELAADAVCAADIVERMCRKALSQTELTSIMRWAAHLPNETILARPRLALDVAWAGRHMESSEMHALIERAGRALATTPRWSASEGRAMHAELHVLEANHLLAVGRLADAEDALQAAFALDPDPEGYTCAYAHLMSGFLRSGVQRSLNERIRSFRRAAMIFERIGFTRGCIEVYRYESLARRRELDIVGMIDAGDRLIRYADAHGWIRSNAAIEGMLYHGEALYFSGAVRPALECLQRAAALLEGERSFTVTSYQLQLRIQLCQLALGEHVEIDLVQDDLAWSQYVVAKGAFTAGNCAYLRMLRDFRMARPERCRGTLEAMSLSLAEVSESQPPNIVRPILVAEVFAGSDDPRVEHGLRRFLLHLRSNGVLFMEMQTHVFLVLFLLHAGREDEAMTELHSVLDDVERTMLVRMLIDFPQLKPLLMRCSFPFARRILRALQARGADDIPYGLSSSEVRVLKMLALGYDAKRAADELCIAYETVRSHTKHLYQKLGVRNRVEAIRVAQKAGLV